MVDSKIDPQELKKLEKLASQIIQIKKELHIGTASLTPINYLEEMKKFFSSNTYDPKYLYKKQSLPNISKTIENCKKELEPIKIPEDLKEHIFEFLDDQNNLYLTKKSIGTPEFTLHAHTLFDWGKDRLDLLLTNTPKVEFSMHIKHTLQDASVIKKRFEKSLDKYKIGGFGVKLDTFSPHIVNVGYHTINIGSEIKRFECNIDRLVVHEIESHVMQTENIKKSKTKLSEFSNYGNMHLYSEGLAIYNEITTRKITPSAFEMYYYRIKAVRNLHKSFREIYEILCENLLPNRAFIMTYRVKRGLADTSMPGGFPKDASYLLGFHEIENLINEKYPKKLLYATKSPVLSTLLAKYDLLDLQNLYTPRFS